MKTIGEKFPEFKKEAVVSLEAGKEFKTLTLDDFKGNGLSFSVAPRLYLCLPDRNCFVQRALR
jgi:hypothetical protein